MGGATMLDCLRHHNATLRALALHGNPLLTPPLQAELAAQLRDNKVPSLQPYVLPPATLRDPACNPI